MSDGWLGLLKLPLLTRLLLVGPPPFSPCVALAGPAVPNMVTRLAAQGIKGGREGCRSTAVIARFLVRHTGPAYRAEHRDCFQLASERRKRKAVCGRPV